LEDQGVGGKIGSEWILGRLAWGCGLDSTGSGQRPVAGCCECCHEPSGSCAKEIVSTYHGVAKSVQCLTTDWTTGVRTPAEAKDFSSILCVQTGSEAHPASYPTGTGSTFHGGKERPGRNADHSPKVEDE
jgi:hypothetical protein